MVAMDDPAMLLPKLLPLGGAKKRGDHEGQEILELGPIGSRFDVAPMPCTTAEEACT